MKWLQKLTGETTTVGLDIGSHAIKIAKILHKKDGFTLQATGIKELPPGTIEGGEIRNRSAFIDAITTLINQCDPGIVDVVISMSGNGIITDKVMFKIDPSENTEEFILWEASQRSPFDVDDITLDYKILSRNQSTSEVEVLLVAAKNQTMQTYIDLLYEAGLKPVMVDVDAFALTNSYALEMSGRAEQGVVMLLNIGHNLTNVTFIKNGVYHSTRDVATAGDFFVKTLVRNLGLAPEVAFALLRGEEDPTLNAGLVKQSIDYAIEELSSGIDLAFSYFRNSEKHDVIDKIILSGGGAHIQGIAGFLENRHETSVRIANPLAHLEYDPELFGRVNPDTISPMLSVAIGLGLRKVGN